MKRARLVVTGLFCLTAPVLATEPAAAASQPARIATVAAASSTGHAPGDDTLAPGGLWRCVRHPRACLADPMQPPTTPEPATRP